jgi:hypothetical protein
MIYQVILEEKHSDLFHFLWGDGKLDRELGDNRMTRHIFSATSSPGCANYALKETANHYEGHFGKAVSYFIRRDFYVDDGAHSIVTPRKAITLIENYQQLCKKEGFHVHKYICNNKEVVDQIPASIRAQNLQSFNTLTHSQLKEHWDPVVCGIGHITVWHKHEGNAINQTRYPSNCKLGV